MPAGSDGKAKAATTMKRRRNSLFLFSSRLLAVRGGGNEAGMSMATAVTTLGDLEPRGKPNHQDGDGSSFWYPRGAFDENGGGMQRGNEGHDEGGEENTEIVLPAAAARMGGRNGGMARIHLDLSGRLVCHLISRRKRSSSGGSGVTTEGRTTPSSSVPLLSLAEPATAMSKQTENGKQKRQQQCNNNAPTSFVKSIATRYIDDVTTFVTRRRLDLLLPHDIYIGTNYNFDEIWYGATRIITKCSWGPYSSLANKSSWSINAEREMNLFDRYDTTSRIRCVQQHPSLPSSSSSVMSPHTTAASRSRQISLEYDSAKLNTNIDNIDNGNDRSAITTMTASRKRSRSNNERRSSNNCQYLAPTMSMHVKTPLFHPRLVAHVKKTWIINTNKYNNQGNNNNNYVIDSANCGDSVNRRYSSILERYSNSIPKSITVHPSIIPMTTTTSGAATRGGGAAAAACRGYKTKLSKWLENDGWLPTKMTVDLLGNIITKNEIGFKTPATTTPLTTKKCQSSSSSTTIIPSRHIIHDMGIRLSLSKKVDWSTMGIIFPWSGNNNSGSSRHNNVGSGGSSSGMFGMLQSTHARLELCGMYGDSSLPQQHGMATGRMSSIGVDVEPLDWSSTFRVTVCHEDVSFL